MKVIFLAYRDWALKVFPSIKKHPKVEEAMLISDSVGLILSMIDIKAGREWEEHPKLDANDLLITCGWSNEVEKIADHIPTIGVHCAELDRYSYGTPVQNQIIDGITKTKHRTFRFTHPPEDSKRSHTHTREYSHEVDLDLSGNMEDILEQMTATSKVLFNMFLDDWPDIKWKKWPEEKERKFARIPEDSKLTKEHFTSLGTEWLYNFMRCLESPYPNAYIEDKEGRLYFEKVRFKKNA